MLDGKSHGCHVRLNRLDQVVDRLDLGVQRFITSGGDLGGGDNW